jgi:hypothetical protein
MCIDVDDDTVRVVRFIPMKITVPSMMLMTAMYMTLFVLTTMMIIMSVIVLMMIWL